VLQRREDRQVFTDVSNVHIAFVQLLDLLDSGAEGITINLNVGKYLTVDKMVTTQKIRLVLHLPRGLALGTDVRFSQISTHFIDPTSKPNLRVLS
jgi:hypothetical protein